MKKFLYLPCFVVVLSTSYIAQTNKTASASQLLEVLSKEPSEAKLNYVKEQNYLSTSSLVDYKNYYGDSLKGFNESKIKNELLAKGIEGWEIAIYVHAQRRAYINEKYSLVKKPAPLLPINMPNGNTPGQNSKFGSAIINATPCVNEDFELTPPGIYTTANAVTGWLVSSRQSNNVCPPPSTSWVGGSTEFSIVATPINGILPTGNIIPHSPLGGTVVARLNNSNAGTNVTRLTQSFPVTANNALFQFAYAGFWQDGGGGHNCCQQPGIQIGMSDCSGNPLACSSLTLIPNALCVSSQVTYSVAPGAYWSNWQVKYIDLTPYIGTCITFEVWTTDCALGGHYGTTLFDAKCGGSILCPQCGIPPTTNSTVLNFGPVNFCAGSGLAQISAPSGYASYQWVSPVTGTIPAPQGTMSTLMIQNPVVGQVYTVNLVSPSGCPFTATNAIAFTSVAIAGIGSNPSCANGASGSATVIGFGSASGYNYNWVNSSNSVVGTNSVVFGLAAGVYTVTISGLGAAACGTAVASVTVGTAPQGVNKLFKPYCGTQAYMVTAGGSGFQWYNGTTLIPPPAGITSSYTIPNPINNAIVTLTYITIQGCRDSVEYTLIASNPGNISVSNISWVCPGGSNGTALISMNPAAGAPPGINSYSVTNANASTPVYNSGINPTIFNAYNLNGLAAGSYSVNAFDGSCKYSTTFNVSTFVYNYTLTPNTATLCQGNTIPANITFTSTPSPPQYTYSWSPSTFMLPGTTNQQNTIITPVVAVGQSLTTIYTVVVTPSVVNCPITKTISITVVNPPVPVITAIPDMCDNASPYSISVSPPGGTFSTGITGPANPIGPTGIITPNASGITFGTNTFIYSIAINTCIATKTGTYHVSHFNSAALTSSVPPLCVTNAPFNLMNIVQSSAGGSWSGATGVSGSGSAFSFNPATLATGSYPISYNTASNPNPTLCPASSQLTVAVTKTVTPVISSVLPFCTNTPTFALSVTPSGGNFFGNPGVGGANGVVTPSALTSAIPGVSYSVVIGPCVNTGNTTMQFSQFNPANFSGSIPELCANSTNAFNLMSIVQNTASGSWTDANNQVVPSGTFSPAGKLTGVYTYYYTRTSSPPMSSCASVNSITLSILNPPIPTITQAGPFCSKDGDAQLSVTPNTGHWTNSAYLSSTGMISPSLCAIGNNPIQYVVGTNTCFSQQTKFVSVEAFAPATITSPIPDQCNTGSPTNLLPFTMSNTGLWTGAGISGTSFNPANSGSGMFTLTYKTASSPSGLCPDQSTIAVNVYSLAPPVLIKPKPICNNGQPVQLNVTPVGGLFAGTNNSAVTFKGLFNPGLGVVGDNVINYSVAVGPCVAYAQTTVTVEKFISADLDHLPSKAVYCQTKDDGFNMMDLVQNLGGTWQSSTGTGGLVGNNFDPLQATVGSNNTYTYVIISPSGICADTSAVRIKVGAIPKATAVLNTPSSGCAPWQVVFNTPGNDAGTGVWVMGDGSDPIKELDVKYVYAKPGTYTATLHYINQEGCPAEPLKSVPIIVYEVPVANFSFPDEVFISNPEIQVTNLSTALNNNSYEWRIPGQGPLTDVNPLIKFPKVGKYPVTLVAQSASGKCSNEITKTIEVKTDFNIFIPSLFSPNLDGINDEFRPVFSEFGLDPKTFEMEIFDRWGHSLFKSKDPNKGWDGTIKGNAAKEDVFSYKIKYKDLDGMLYNKVGVVLLIK